MECLPDLEEKIRRVQIRPCVINRGLRELQMEEVVPGEDCKVPPASYPAVGATFSMGPAISAIVLPCRCASLGAVFAPVRKAKGVNAAPDVMA